MENMNTGLAKALYACIQLPRSAAVLDVGCKDAGFLNDLLDRFPGLIQKAVGVDITDRHFAAIPYSKPVELQVMNCAKQFAFPDASFDLVFAKEMLECISDKTGFVREVHRVLKPGGMVVCVNTDFDSIVYNAEDKALLTKTVHTYAVTKQPWMDDLDDWMGRRTYAIFHTTGLFKSEIRVYQLVETSYAPGTAGYAFSQDVAWLAEDGAGALSRQEYETFLSELHSADEKGTYLYARPYYIYLGVKDA